MPKPNQLLPQTRSARYSLWVGHREATAQPGQLDFSGEVLSRAVVAIPGGRGWQDSQLVRIDPPVGAFILKSNSLHQFISLRRATARRLKDPPLALLETRPRASLTHAHDYFHSELPLFSPPEKQ